MINFIKRLFSSRSTPDELLLDHRILDVKAVMSELDRGNLPGCMQDENSPNGCGSSERTIVNVSDCSSTAISSASLVEYPYLGSCSTSCGH